MHKEKILSLQTHHWTSCVFPKNTEGTIYLMFYVKSCNSSLRPFVFCVQLKQRPATSIIQRGQDWQELVKMFSLCFFLSYQVLIILLVFS